MLFEVGLSDLEPLTFFPHCIGISGQITEVRIRRFPKAASIFLRRLRPNLTSELPETLITGNT